MEPLTCVSGNSAQHSRSAWRLACFNGAAHLRERKQHPDRRQGDPQVRASMEPLTCVSGNSGTRRRRAVRCSGFNGAAHLRERKHHMQPGDGR